jgi:hypothetical protein
MSCDINELLREGACFQCLDQRGQQMAILQLLCTISTSGGGGGGTQMVFFGPSDPNGSVTASVPSIYYGADGSIWGKTSGSGNTGWEPYIAGAVASEPIMAMARSEPMVVEAQEPPEPQPISLPLDRPEAKAPVVISKSIMSRVREWFSTNLFSWFILLIALCAPAQAVPPPLVRNILTTNDTIVGAGGITISTIPGTTTITGSGGGGGSITGGTNIGSGVGIFGGTNNNLIQFKSLLLIATNVPAFWATNSITAILFYPTNYLLSSNGVMGGNLNGNQWSITNLNELVANTLTILGTLSVNTLSVTGRTVLADIGLLSLTNGTPAIIEHNLGYTPNVSWSMRLTNDLNDGTWDGFLLGGTDYSMANFTREAEFSGSGKFFNPFFLSVTSSNLIVGTVEWAFSGMNSVYPLNGLFIPTPIDSATNFFIRCYANP